MGVGGQRHAPATLPLGKDLVPICRRLGSPQGRSGWVRKISPPPGVDPWTIQPIASCYTDWSILAYYLKPWRLKYLELQYCLASIYGCEAWYLTLRDKQRLMMFENMVLKNMYRPDGGGNNQRWGKVSNEELHDLLSLSHVTYLFTYLLNYLLHGAESLRS
jgi:hypothetical protein